MNKTKIKYYTEILSGILTYPLLPKFKKYSQLIIKSDGNDWVQNQQSKEMIPVCKKLKISTLDRKYSHLIKNQCIFHFSKYSILNNWKKPKNKIAFPYYHGDPKSDPSFFKMIKCIEKNHNHISRIQVPHSQIEEIILNTGISENKVFRIPISIDINNFNLVDEIKRDLSRKKLNIPKDLNLVGSFQKDGQGWGEGLEPKLIKGPDIFLSTLKILKDKIPNLGVLLTGPSRGYIKNGLKNLGIPYFHKYINNYLNIQEYYHALNLYIISSREEGGPRALLESMASGIPLVTTNMGMAIDLVQHKKNAWKVDVEDSESLAFWSSHVLKNKDSIKNNLLEARKTAEENSYDKQHRIWQEFMQGFINF